MRTAFNSEEEENKLINKLKYIPLGRDQKCKHCANRKWIIFCVIYFCRVCYRNTKRFKCIYAALHFIYQSTWNAHNYVRVRRPRAAIIRLGVVPLPTHKHTYIHTLTLTPEAATRRPRRRYTWHLCTWFARWRKQFRRCDHDDDVDSAMLFNSRGLDGVASICCLAVARRFTFIPSAMNSRGAITITSRMMRGMHYISRLCVMVMLEVLYMYMSNVRYGYVCRFNNLSIKLTCRFCK